MQVTRGESSRSEQKDGLRAEIQRLVRQYTEIEFAPREFVAGETAVPPAGKLLGSEEIQNMVDAALDGWLTTGRFNAEFERRLARFFGIRSAMTVNSGSSANLVAFATLTSPKLGERAIRSGDEVIAVAAGFPTTVNPILQYGAIPVFVDVRPDTYNVDIAALQRAITPKTKAIMLAHTLGNPFDLGSVMELVQKHGLWLIEDCCDALGSRFEGRLVGTFGHLATLSFYPAHHITMGEGGAVLTDDPKLRRIAESFRDWGRDCFCDPGCDNTCGKRYGWRLGSLPEGYDHKYIYSHVGYNLKITDMQAACGLAQLTRVEEFIAARKRNFATLRRLLEPCEPMLQLPKATAGTDPSWFGFPITVTESAPKRRLEIIRDLEAQKIGTRLLFAGNLIRQPSMAGQRYRVSENLDVTDRIMERTFWIGVQPALDENALRHVARVLKSALGVGV